MPLVRIAVLRGKPVELRRQIGDAVHRAMVQTIGVPALDRFQVLNEYEPGDLVYDPNYLGITRTDGLVVIQLTISTGRSLEMKRALYEAIARNLAELGVRREDVWINLVEVAKENWSFGNGEASYAPARMDASPRGAHVQGRTAQG